MKLFIISLSLLCSVSFAKQNDRVGPNGGKTGSVEVITLGQENKKSANVSIDGDAAKELFKILAQKGESGSREQGYLTLKWAKSGVFSCGANINHKPGNEYEIWVCNLGVDENGNVNSGYSIPKGGGSVGN